MILINFGWYFNSSMGKMTCAHQIFKYFGRSISHNNNHIIITKYQSSTSKLYWFDFGHFNPTTINDIHRTIQRIQHLNSTPILELRIDFSWWLHRFLFASRTFFVWLFLEGNKWNRSIPVRMLHVYVLCEWL